MNDKRESWGSTFWRKDGGNLVIEYEIIRKE
jgi:hypothetical protein